MGTTILTGFLKALGVKYTKEFADKAYRTHPYKYTLYGLSNMLNRYHIPNAGIRVEDKDINRLSPPFIAYVSNDFAIVNAISKEEVTYQWNGRILTNDIHKFKEGWDGVILLAEPQTTSVEPEYKEHLIRQWMHRLQKYTIGCLFGILLCLFYLSFFMDGNWGYAVIFSFSLLGMGVSYFLLLKQEKIQSEYADKICSLFHQKDCNDILESSAAKIGVFTWSEIGFGYFFSNVLLIVLFPDLIRYLVLINMIALPYTVWSIWYQYRIAHQWCALCLSVQGILWGICVSNCFLGYTPFPLFTMTDMITIALLYLLPPLLINKQVQMMSDSNKIDTIIQESESFKNRSDVFEAILKQQPYYAVHKDTSKILFGNPDAKMEITILTNPHCEPCARMHQRIEDLLKDIGDKIYVQYVFSAFTDELVQSNRFLIAAYLQTNDRESLLPIYSTWFQKEKYAPKAYIQKNNFDINNEEVEIELRKHTEWKEANKLMATPTILINGYKLPNEYKIENIRYLTDLEIN